MGVVSLGSAGNMGASSSAEASAALSGVNTASRVHTSVVKGSSLVNTLLKYGKYVVPLLRATTRLNPYFTGAMALYDAYDYFSSPSSSSSGKSGAVPLSGSGKGQAVSSSASSSVGGAVGGDSSVAGRTYESAMTSLQNPAKVKVLPKIELSESSSTDGKTLLSVLEQNNRQLLEAMSMMLESSNANAVSTSNVAKSMNMVGLMLGQIASDNSSMASVTSSFYVDLLKILSSAFPEKSEENIADSLNDLYESDDGYTIPHARGRADITTTRTFVDSTEDLDASVSGFESVSASIDSLVSAINPDGRSDYFVKQNVLSDFQANDVSITDLDGNVVVTDAPMKVKARADASVARKVTDENNFELDDDDFDDDFNSLMPDISEIFGSNNVSEIISGL